jgi:nucleoid-associated protein EbfC
MFNIPDMMKKAQEVQGQLQSIQQDLRNRTTTGESGAGMVTVVVTGAQELVSIEIEASILQADNKKMVEDLIIAAVNNGLHNSRAMAETEMKKVTSLLPNIPGLPF